MCFTPKIIPSLLRWNEYIFLEDSDGNDNIFENNNKDEYQYNIDALEFADDFTISATNHRPCYHYTSSLNWYELWHLG